MNRPHQLAHKLLNPKTMDATEQDSAPLRRTLGSFGWLTLERMFRLGVGIFVTAWVARYLGPDKFGAWNHALAFTFIFSALAGAGLDGVVVRELVERPLDRAKLLGSALAIRLCSGMIALVCAVIAIALSQPGDRQSLILITICALGFLFQAGQFAEFDFQSRQESRYPALALSFAFASMTLAKIGLILINASLIAFVVCGTLEIAIGSALLLLFFATRTSPRLEFDWPTIRSMLRAGLRPTLCTLCIAISLRLDQVLITRLLGDAANGVYAATIRLGESWYFVPVAIATSVLPLLVREKSTFIGQISGKTVMFFDAMAVIGYLACFVLLLGGPLIVGLLYGERYLGSGHIIMLHSLAAVFVTLGVAAQTWLTSRNLLGYALLRLSIGCVAGVSLNLLLIPQLGLVGAPISYVASQALMTCCLVCFPATRAVGLQVLSSLAPWISGPRLWHALPRLRSASS